MATNYTSPDKTASVAFRPNGVYLGLVTRVDSNIKRVWVMIPRVSSGFQFGPLSVAMTDLPSVGDRVACLFVENRSDDIVVIGVIKSTTSPLYATPITCLSTERPSDPSLGQMIYESDTTKTLLWNGTTWTGLNIDTLLVDSNTLFVDATNNRVGVNTASPTVALDVSGAVKSNSTIDATGTIASTGAVSAGTTVSAGTSITAGTSIYAGTSISGASLSATGPVSAASGSISGNVSAQTLTLTQASGTAPMTVSSTDLVTNLNADLLDGQHGSVFAPPGMVTPYAGISAPTGWLLADGSSVSRTTYAALFSALTTTVGTVTISNASPGVVTRTSHGLVEGDAVYLTTTGTLPTGLSANTTYYVKYVNANTFQLSASRTATASSGSAASFAAGTAINTSSAGSGTHTIVKAPYGVASSTTFNLPDLRGRLPVGVDNMSGSDAGRLSSPNALGGTTGFETHTLLEAELAQHSHNNTVSLTNATVASDTHAHTEGTLQAAAGAVNNDSGSYWYEAQNPRVGGRGPTSTGFYTLFGMATSTLSYFINHWTGVYGTTANANATKTVGASITNVNAGSNGAHNNMPPYMALNYIIKT